MASYIDGSLLNDETILHRGHISLWSMFPLILLGIVLAPIGIGLVLLIMAYIRYNTTELAITNKRVVVKTGLISRKVIEINIVKSSQSKSNKVCSAECLISAHSVYRAQALIRRPFQIFRTQ